MHPLLVARSRFILYLAAWTPFLALLAYASRADDASWAQTAAALTPAVFLFAFACLSPWYICRVQPLQVSEITRLPITWGAAAFSAGGLLAGGAYLSARLLERPVPNLGLLAGLGAILYLLSAGLHYTALAAEASRQAEKRAAEARSLARDAELQALRMQINPHFLFNSLHSIAALATQDGARARDMCIRLSDFLRSSLALSGRESIPLSEELALARSYLVGDKASDLAAGGAAGCKCILVRTGYGTLVDVTAPDPRWNLVRVAADVGDALWHLLPGLAPAGQKRSA